MNNLKSNRKESSPKQREELLEILKSRFEKSLSRHKILDWAKVQARLEAKLDKLWSLLEMEVAGGEPDVLGLVSLFRSDFISWCSQFTPRVVA